MLILPFDEEHRARKDGKFDDDEKPYQCICGKAYAIQRSLTSHVYAKTKRKKVKKVK